MYETFYGLHVKPFTLTPNPDFLYGGETHRVALAILKYVILHEAGFVVLTGKPGMGKTTLLQQLLAEHQHRFSIGLIAHTQQRRAIPGALDSSSIRIELKKPGQARRISHLLTVSEKSPLPGGGSC